MTLAPTPRLLEELQDMADGFRREDGEVVGRSEEAARAAAALIERLGTLTRLPEVETALVPYSAPDLPALARSLPVDIRTDGIAAQVTEGQRVLSSVLRDVELSWFMPPGGRLDRASLEVLRTLGAARRTFVSASSLVRPDDPALAGCPAASPSFTCPAIIEVGTEAARALVGDADIQQVLTDLARPGQDVLDLQRVFAETAMVHAELPGTEGRVIQMMLPRLWPAETRSLVGPLVDGLASAPWLESMAPSEALRAGVTDAPRNAVDEIPPLPGDPGITYFSTVAASQRVVSTFFEIRPPTDMIERLKRNLLVAHGSAWWTQDQPTLSGLDHATESRAEAEGELAKIRLGGTDQITLTSRRGALNLIVFNDTGYPVTLRVALSSPKLAFDQREPQEFPPEQTPIDVQVTARSSGIFPITVRLESPAGSFIDAPGWSKQVSVRSTEFNQIALVVTVGALFFLIAFYLFRGWRMRKGGGGEHPEATPA